MRISKLNTAIAISVISALALPGVAGAHVDVEPTKAPAGKLLKLNFSVGHGCEGVATTSLTVQVPKVAEKSRASSTPGWRATNKEGQMKWTGGPLPDHDLQKYPFTATLYGKKGDRIPLKVIQGCEGGASTAWIQVAAKGQAEPETPAPVVTLTSSAGQPGPVTPEGGGDPGVEDPETATAASESEDDEEVADALIIAIFAVVAIGLVGGGLYWMRRRPTD